MNIYQKLQQARVRLQSVDMKKSGNNKFAGYRYFELGDFLPEINKIFQDLGLCDVIQFDASLATLTIFNAEKPDEQLFFTSPMAEAQLKGCHPIQNLGAVETYQRRYLWTTAMGIVEHDALDAGGEKEEERPKVTGIKRPTVTDGLSESAITQYIKAIKTAKNLGELQDAYVTAYRIAKDAKSETALNAFAGAKDARKEELHAESVEAA